MQEDAGLETLREAYSSSSRMVSTASQAFPSLKKYIERSNINTIPRPPVSLTMRHRLIPGISDDLKDTLSAAVRSLLHHFDASSPIRFMLCLRNQFEAPSYDVSPKRVTLGHSNSTDTD